MSTSDEHQRRITYLRGRFTKSEGQPRSYGQVCDGEVAAHHPGEVATDRRVGLALQNLARELVGADTTATVTLAGAAVDVRPASRRAVAGRDIDSHLMTDSTNKERLVINLNINGDTCQTAPALEALPPHRLVPTRTLQDVVRSHTLDELDRALASVEDMLDDLDRRKSTLIVPRAALVTERNRRRGRVQETGRVVPFAPRRPLKVQKPVLPPQE